MALWCDVFQSWSSAASLIPGIVLLRRGFLGVSVSAFFAFAFSAGQSALFRLQFLRCPLDEQKLIAPRQSLGNVGIGQRFIENGSQL